MSSVEQRDVVLVGYQDQGNLGMGYLASCLQEHGYTVTLCEIRDGAESVAEVVQREQPLVVGFSLIFQFFLPQFRDVAVHLRRLGIGSHFTMGGHYASLCTEDALAAFQKAIKANNTADASTAATKFATTAQSYLSKHP